MRRCAGERAVFLVDIMNPCWIYEDADLSEVTAIATSVGQVPFNFQIGDDVKKIPLRAPATRPGELEVRIDGCDGEKIAVAAARARRRQLRGHAAAAGRDRAAPGRARSVLHVHARQRRSDLGHRQRRAGREAVAASRPDRTAPRLQLRSPLRGWCAPLDETPDAVFAQRMLGDGVAIDPTGDTLHAPCDGVVISVAPSKHAITIRAADGAEILMHVGIDTVALAGEGFQRARGAGRARAQRRAAAAASISTCSLAGRRVSSRRSS